MANCGRILQGHCRSATPAAGADRAQRTEEPQHAGVTAGIRSARSAGIVAVARCNLGCKEACVLQPQEVFEIEPIRRRWQGHCASATMMATLSVSDASRMLSLTARASQNGPKAACFSCYRISICRTPLWKVRCGRNPGFARTAQRRWAFRGGNLMRRLIFGLVAAAGVAAYSQSSVGATAAGTGTAGASTGAAATSRNPKDVAWTQHGGNPDEQRYSKLN